MKRSNQRSKITPPDGVRYTRNRSPPKPDEHMSKILRAFEGVWSAYLNADCVLSEHELARLSSHIYMAVDTSWLDEMCMKRFWDFIVQYLPLWLAPNLITLIGLIINLITLFVLSSYCYSATEHAPTFAYLLAALGIFIYQTLDATDGKQARRTNSSSPLGELFDHGCDSMAQVFITLNVCYAMQLGSEKNLVFLTLLVSIMVYYCAHWSTYCTGKLKFSRFDVTEAQMFVIGILVMTALAGPNIWNLKVFSSLSLRFVFTSAGFFFAFWQLAGYMRTILTEGVGRNGSTVAGTSVIFPLFPLLLFCTLFAMLYYKSTSGLFDKNITLLALCFGAVGAKVTNRLIIAHMSRSELRFWDWIYMAPLSIILNQYYDIHFSEYSLLIAATVYAYISLVIFCWFVCRQLCDYLKIECFRIKPQC